MNALQWVPAGTQIVVQWTASNKCEAWAFLIVFYGTKWSGFRTPYNLWMFILCSTVPNENGSKSAKAKISPDFFEGLMRGIESCVEWRESEQNTAVDGAKYAYLLPL